MSPRYGLIIADGDQVAPLLAGAELAEMKTSYGLVSVKKIGKWAVFCRSGFDGVYVPPHEYNALAHLMAVKEMGLTDLIGVYSVGSLRPSLTPGTLVVVDDWIDLSLPTTVITGERRFLTPSLCERVRQNLASAAWKSELKFENGGVFWQTLGPRLETKAEIKLMSNYADVVGRGMAGEAGLAQELNLDFAALCSVDNYANGLGSPRLTDAGIKAQSVKGAASLVTLLNLYQGS